MGETGGATRTKASAEPAAAGKDDLSVIREQVCANGDLLRENTSLLRKLIELMLPKAQPDGQPMHELLSLLIAQQQQTLFLVQQHAADMSVLLERVVGEHRQSTNGSGTGA